MGLEKSAAMVMASVGGGKDEEAISWGMKIPLSFCN
jgi:hypothetical protein